MDSSPSDQPLPASLPLGRNTPSPDHYDPGVLCPVPRQPARRALGIESDALPFTGEDIWNAWELSWLLPGGKPVVAQAELRFPADSPAIIESKSLKLYLNSLNQSQFESRDQVQQVLHRDLSQVAGAPVAVAVSDLRSGTTGDLPGICLDGLAVETAEYQVNPALLEAGERVVSEQLHSHLLRSLCPVTGQPDWASILVDYRGPAIDRSGLLRYLVSYRQHREFHEQCVERIYLDIQARCRPQQLSVSARYLRRGGLDINPCRSSHPVHWRNRRLQRQ